MSFQDHIADYQQRIETYLEHYLPTEKTEPQLLHRAMRYAVIGGGKRIRPLLVYACGELFSAPLEKLDAIAAAIELIHAYSLVHDDLPAMDDDELRRGKPTVHIAFDEATAILVGDALQTQAFSILARDTFLQTEPLLALRAIELLAHASGSLGMVGGQALDLAAEQQKLSQTELDQMFQLKTGALLKCSIIMPAIIANAPQESIEKLTRFADCIGLAFQIRDDILDIEGTTAQIGKPQGSDIENNKATYPALLGLDKAKARADNLWTEADKLLSSFGPKAESLHWVSQFIINRHS